MRLWDNIHFPHLTHTNCSCRQPNLLSRYLLLKASGFNLRDSRRFFYREIQYAARSHPNKKHFYFRVTYCSGIWFQPTEIQDIFFREIEYEERSQPDNNQFLKKYNYLLLMFLTENYSKTGMRQGVLRIQIIFIKYIEVQGDNRIQIIFLYYSFFTLSTQESWRQFLTVLYGKNWYTAMSQPHTGTSYLLSLLFWESRLYRIELWELRIIANLRNLVSMPTELPVLNRRSSTFVANWELLLFWWTESAYLLNYCTLWKRGMQEFVLQNLFIYWYWKLQKLVILYFKKKLVMSHFAPKSTGGFAPKSIGGYVTNHFMKYS
jgi:hypothetical protein